MQKCPCETCTATLCHCVEVFEYWCKIKAELQEKYTKTCDSWASLDMRQNAETLAKQKYLDGILDLIIEIL